MTVLSLESLPELYEQDEVAWLDAMAELARDGRATDLDLPHLAECLSDMAIRERREVESRMVVLLAHVLKWEHQPKKRSRSWKLTVLAQRQELNRHATKGVLRNHATEVLADMYREAVDRAVIETGLAKHRFPAACPYTLDQLLTIEVVGGP